MTENEISKQILDSAIMVHKEIGGPGLLETCYEAALACELRCRGLCVQTQKIIPVMYRGMIIGSPYRIDLLVDDKVIVECKATEQNNLLYNAQVLTYLRLTKLKLGIVINFGQPTIKDGFFRVANGL